MHAHRMAQKTLSAAPRQNLLAERICNRDSSRCVIPIDVRMECFVCSGAEGVMYQMCNCTSLYVHEDCFKQLLRVPAHRHRCPMCLTEYPMRRRISHRTRCTFTSKQLEGYIGNFVVGAVCGVYLFMFDTYPFREFPLFWRMFLLCAAVLVLLGNVFCVVLLIMVQCFTDLCFRIDRTETYDIRFPLPLQRV